MVANDRAGRVVGGVGGAVSRSKGERGHQHHGQRNLPEHLRGRLGATECRQPRLDHRLSSLRYALRRRRLRLLRPNAVAPRPAPTASRSSQGSSPRISSGMPVEPGTTAVTIVPSEVGKRSARGGTVFPDGWETGAGATKFGVKPVVHPLGTMMRLVSRATCAVCARALPQSVAPVFIVM